MLRIIRLTIATSIFLIACGHRPKHKASATEITYPKGIVYAKIVNIDLLFPKGTHKVHYMVRKRLTSDQKKIYRRLWNKTAKGDTANIYALSKSERSTLLNMLYNPDYISGAGKISINDSDGKIHFHGDGILSVLDSLTIDVDDSSAMFGANSLSIADTSKISEITPDSDYLELPLVYRELHTLSWLRRPNFFILCISRLGKSGKTLLYLKGVEFKDLLPIHMLIEVIIE
jgi:hypothetical protein